MSTVVGAGSYITTNRCSAARRISYLHFYTVFHNSLKFSASSKSEHKPRVVSSRANLSLFFDYINFFSVSSEKNASY